MLPSEEMESNALQCEADYDFFFAMRKRRWKQKLHKMFNGKHTHWKTIIKIER